MKKRKATSMVCDQKESQSYGFQCVRGFTMEHKRQGIERHCHNCIEGE